MDRMRVVSLFSGVGGLDSGFQNAGFDIVWANEIDRSILPTYVANHSGMVIDSRRLESIPSSEIADADVIIGGPPCQSWSLAGNLKGAGDPRGKLFYEYVRVIREKKPKAFVAENVPGITSSRHEAEFEKIVREFAACGYSVGARLLRAEEYGVPQSRERVVIIGHRDGDAKAILDGIEKVGKAISLKEAIGDLQDPLPARAQNRTNGWCQPANHEFFVGGFSGRYMSRNRMRGWSELSFTIQASGRHAPLHPSSGGMREIGKDQFEFVCPDQVRRMSVRECARVQTFPDSFGFLYSDINDGYKMIGNAVPIKMAEAIANAIREKIK